VSPAGPSQVIEEAIRLAASGEHSRAAGMLRELLEARPEPEQGRRAFELLVHMLFLSGMHGRAFKVFRRHIAAYTELPDPSYDDAYLNASLATRTSPVPLRRRDRFLRLLRALEAVLPLDGLVAECGCAKGLSSFLLCSRLRQADPAFSGAGYEIYDSFQGLSEPGVEDQGVDADDDADAPSERDVRAGRFAAPLEVVQQALAPFPAIAFFPGWIPAAFDQETSKKYRFVHVDVDLYQPTKASFEYFWPRLQPGAAMVCDDYGWPGAKRAVREFCEASGATFEVTPSNQAVLRR
jgi:O-methyltransferase